MATFSFFPFCFRKDSNDIFAMSRDVENLRRASRPYARLAVRSHARGPASASPIDEIIVTMPDRSDSCLRTRPLKSTERAGRPWPAIRGIAVLMIAAGLLTGSPARPAEAAAQGCAPALDARLNEEILMVPVREGNAVVRLQTTLFRPSGPGPFPLVVLNHGKDPGDARLQPRSRHLRVAAEFVQRGYVVAIPMRQGYAGSGGLYHGDGCDSRHHGLDEAADVAGAIAALGVLPYVDESRIVAIGQSDGGLATIALGAWTIPGLRGLINFSGGVQKSACAGWQDTLVAAYASYGRASHYPSLWFYGDNDTLWPQPLPQRMFGAYRANARGPAAEARYVDIGRIGADSHDFFDTPGGVSLWLPQVATFLRARGLPFDPVVAPRQP